MILNSNNNNKALNFDKNFKLTMKEDYSENIGIIHLQEISLFVQLHNFSQRELQSSRNIII